MKRNSVAFWVGAAVFLVAALVMTQIVRNQYPFFAGYIILQFIALAVAWSILGGYAGYVNFGTSAFYGVGVYASVFLVKAFGAPLPLQILAGAAIGALLVSAMLIDVLGLPAIGLRGAAFAICVSMLAVRFARMARIDVVTAAA